MKVEEKNNNQNQEITKNEPDIGGVQKEKGGEQEKQNPKDQNKNISGNHFRKNKCFKTCSFFCYVMISCNCFLTKSFKNPLNFSQILIIIKFK